MRRGQSESRMKLTYLMRRVVLLAVFMVSLLLCKEYMEMLKWQELTDDDVDEDELAMEARYREVSVDDVDDEDGDDDGGEEGGVGDDVGGDGDTEEGDVTGDEEEESEYEDGEEEEGEDEDEEGEEEEEEEEGVVVMPPLPGVDQETADTVPDDAIRKLPVKQPATRAPQVPKYILESYQKMKNVTNSNNAIRLSEENFPSWVNNYYVLYVTSKTQPYQIDITPASNILHFRLKACTDAFLIYASQYQKVNLNSYVLGLGYYEAQTVIWKQGTNSTKTVFATPDEAKIHCDKLQSYLVNYYKGTFQLSVETTLQPYVTWSDPEPLESKYITLAIAAPDQVALWQLNINSVQVLRADTGPDYSYEQLWMTTMYRPHAFVSVKACRNVHVFVSDKVGRISETGYEVILGHADNTLSAIREKAAGDNVVSAMMVGILDCNLYSTFWLRWSDGKLEVGRGTKMGVRRILVHARADHPDEVRSLGLSTGQGVTGRWLFKQSDEQPGSVMS